MRELATFLFFFASLVTYGQTLITAPGNISEVSEIVQLADGLSFEKVFLVKTDREARMNHGDETVANPFSKIVSGVPEVGIVHISENTMVYETAAIKNGVGVKVVYLYDLYKGGAILVRKKQIPNRPTEFYFYGFENGKLLLHIKANSIVDSQTTDPRDYVAHVSGDWSRYITPNTKVSADINKDGRVDQLDLLLFQSTWNEAANQ